MVHIHLVLQHHARLAQQTITLKKETPIALLCLQDSRKIQLITVLRLVHTRPIATGVTTLVLPVLMAISVQKNPSSTSANLAVLEDRIVRLVCSTSAPLESLE